MQPGQTLTDIAAASLPGLEAVMAEETPDLVLVHGDTSTTLWGALAAFYRKIPVGHVEAGLRTGDKFAPFPEEMNRRLVGGLADLHFAPTAWARDNLRREGVAEEDIFVTGNTAVDALLWTVGRAAGLPAREGRLLLVDAHRRENLGEPMEEICLSVRELAGTYPDLRVIFSVHPNPWVVEPARRLLGGVERVRLVDPLSYPEWAGLMAQATFILSDSGGIQEEAASLGVPVLLLREVTERPEAVAAGTVRVVGTKRGSILPACRRLLDDPLERERMSRATNPYGDGRAAQRIAQIIEYRFGWREKLPTAFRAKTQV
jgi:UDP-N-acetylglucosamine 2-epimerase (non-hydrolysing)